MITVHKCEHGVRFQENGYVLFVTSHTEAQTIHDELSHLLSVTPVPQSPVPDPALELARRIMSIANETGLKPRLVYAIIGNVEWEAKIAAEKAAEAAAPQENPTDA